MRKRRYAFGAILASVLLVILAACQGNNAGASSRAAVRPAR